MSDFFGNLEPSLAYGEWVEESDPSILGRKYWLNAAYEEASIAQKDSEELKMVNKYIDYLASKQWGPGLASYKAKPINNRMLRLYWELVGQLTDLHPVSEVKTSLTSDNPKFDSFNKQANIINGCLRSWWINNNVDMYMAMCICWALLTTSFAKYQFNAEANMGLGELEMIPRGPSSLLMLNPKFDLQDSDAVIDEQVVSVGWARRKYPRRAHLIHADEDLSKYTTEAGVPGHISPIQYKNLSLAMQHLTAGDPKVNYSAFPKCRLRQFWIHDDHINESNVEVMMGDPATNWCYKVKPGRMLYPRGRLLVMAGSALVHDGPNPHWHGRYPYGMLRLNVVPWSIYGQSQLRSWMDLQDIVNQVYAGVMNMMRKAVNPTLYAPKQAFTADQWDKMDTGKPGLRLAYNQQVAHEPKFVSVPQLPGFILPMLMQVEREMDQQSGIATVQEMMKKKQMPSGDTLDQVRQMQTGPVRLQGRNIELFMREGGLQTMWNMFQFYSTKRRMHIAGNLGVTGEDYDYDPGTMIPAGVDPVEHARNFGFYLQQGSLLTIQRVQKVAEIMALRKLHDIDRRTMWKALEIPYSIDEVEKNLQQEAQQGIGMAPSKKSGKANVGAAARAAGL